MQRKGPPSLNLSVKLEWLCLQHRQAGSGPQSPVKWESVESGQGWTLRRSSSLEHTYRECERPGSGEEGGAVGGGGGQKPACMFVHCPLRAHQHQDQRACSVHTHTHGINQHRSHTFVQFGTIKYIYTHTVYIYTHTVCIYTLCVYM